MPMDDKEAESDYEDEDDSMRPEQPPPTPPARFLVRDINAFRQAVALVHKDVKGLIDDSPTSDLQPPPGIRRRGLGDVTSETHRYR